MDPFLERYWGDVHATLIGYVRDDIAPQLADGLAARIEENVRIDDSEGRLQRTIRPDAFVSSRYPSSTGSTSGSSAAVLDEPTYLEPLDDELIERSLNIIDLAGDRVITAIEILSPSNKRAGDGLERYMEKRKKYLSSGTSLVEIDLVRTGQWADMVGRVHIHESAWSTYRVSVSLPGKGGVYQYPISLTSKLPTIEIPLRPADVPARVNLQDLLDRAYKMGRYDRTNYSQPCSPPFTDAECKVVQPFLSAAR